MRSKVCSLLLAAVGSGVLISLILPQWALVAVLGCVLVAAGVCSSKKF